MSYVSFLNKNDHKKEHFYLQANTLSSDVWLSDKISGLNWNHDLFPCVWLSGRLMATKYWWLRKCHRTNTNNLTRYLWKMTRCLLLNWAQWTESRLTSNILNTCQCTVKSFTARTVENLSLRPHCKIKSDMSYITSQWHLHWTPSTSRHPVYFGLNGFMHTTNLFSVFTAISHETLRITAQQYDILPSDTTKGDFYSN